MKVSTAEIQKLVTRWQPRLGLRHWSIEVAENGHMENDDAILEVERHENAHRAVIHVAPWLVKGADHQQIETIDVTYVEKAVVHELCHLHFRDVVFPIRDDVTEILGSVTGELLMRQLQRAEEASVDLLSRALVDSWPKRKK